MDGCSKKISVLSAVETILTHTSKGPLTSDCSCSWISEFPIALLSERWWKDKHIQMWREIVLVPHHIYNRIPTKNRNRDVLKKENCSFQKAAVVSLWGRKHEDCSRLMKTREESTLRQSPRQPGQTVKQKLNWITAPQSSWKWCNAESQNALIVSNYYFVWDDSEK